MKAALSLVLLASLVCLASLVLLRSSPTAQGADGVGEVSDVGQQFCDGLSDGNATLVCSSTTAGYWSRIEASLPGGSYRSLAVARLLGPDTAILYAERTHRGLVEVVILTLKRQDGKWLVSAGPVQ